MDKKTLWLLIHRWAGIVLGVFFLLSCISGAILVFEKELDPLLYPKHFQHDGSSGKLALPLDSLINLAKRYSGENKLAQLIIQPSFPDRGNALFKTEGGRLERTYLALDPFSGQLMSRIEGKRHIFTFSEEFHRRLLMGSLGKRITGILLLGYILILLSGLVLWWPKNKKVFSQRLKVKWDASRKRLNWDIHVVGGWYSLLLLILMCLTALSWSFKSVEAAIYVLLDGKNKIEDHVDPVFARVNAHQTEPFQWIADQAEKLWGRSETLLIDFGKDQDKPVILLRDQDEYHFDRYNGRLLGKKIHARQSLGTRVGEYMEPLHTGSRFGPVGKLIYLLVVMFGASLPITGIYIWLGRKNKGRKK